MTFLTKCVTLFPERRDKMARKITEELIQEMKRLYKENGCYSMTAKQLGVSPATVSKYLKKTMEKKEKTIDVYNGPQPQMPEKEKILAFDGERKIISDGENNVFLLRRV